MSKFKVGDRVICTISSMAIPAFVAGNKYIVKDVSGVDQYGEPTFLYFEGIDHAGASGRFELYQEPPKEEPTVTHKFNVGDKVKCIEAFPHQQIKVGSIYTVSDFEEELIYLKELMGGYCPTRFELFLEAPQGDPFTPPDAINPNHYTQFAIQPLTYIRANGLNFTRGNIVKYATRAGFKDGSEDIEDLNKIIRYAQAEIEAIKRERDVRNGLADVYEVWNRAI